MPEITKRKVTLSRPLPLWNELTQQWDVQGDHVVVDYVPDDERGGENVLKAYVADAKTRWGVVDVGDLDAGEGGYDGQTVIPDTLDHPLAGTTYPETGVTEQQPQAQFSTVALRNGRVAGGTGLVTAIALQSTAAAATAGTEISGGSPAYARKAPSWSTAANSAQSTSQTHDVPSGATVASIAEYTALTGGTFLAAVDVTSQGFSSQGTYQSSLTDTQS